MREKREVWDKQSVPEERWGKDHWSTLLYLESRDVDYRGKVAPEKMRTSRRNRRLAGVIAGRANIMGRDEYPTRLKPTGAERADCDVVLLCGGHDDWECMLDFEAAGLLTAEVGEAGALHPLPVTVRLTAEGREKAAQARARKATTGKAAV